MMISFIKGKKLSKPTWPYMKNELPACLPKVLQERNIDSSRRS